MKKFVLFFTLLSSILYGDAQFYVGSNYGIYYETIEAQGQEAYSNTENIALKVGYGDRGAYAFELSVDASNNEANILSTDDSKRFTFNVELLKAFDFDLFFNPFVKIGIGAGYLQVDRQTNSTLNFGSFNFGAGTFIPLSKSLDLELGYIYKNISYEKVNLLDDKVELNSDQGGAYAGFNVRF